MPQETMTPRERWLAVLRREKPDRVPMDYWTTDEAREKLLRHLGLSDELSMLKRLHIDRPFSVSPRYVGPPIPPDRDVYGIVYRDVDYGTGVYREVAVSPLARYTTRGRDRGQLLLAQPRLVGLQRPALSDCRLRGVPHPRGRL